MASVWEKFDQNFDLDGLQEDIKGAADGGSGVDVPHGNYEVSVEKMELKETKKGDPMLSIWFKIIAGDYENNLIFYNQVLKTGFGIHSANEMLKSLETGDEIEFKSFVQYDVLIAGVFEGTEKLEYALKYGENKKGYSTYEITDVFEN